jgi:hypothetical protein
MTAATLFATRSLCSLEPLRTQRKPDFLCFPQCHSGAELSARVYNLNELHIQVFYHNALKIIASAEDLC